jgi:hypothetical protein
VAKIPSIASKYRIKIIHYGILIEPVTLIVEIDTVIVSFVVPINIIRDMQDATLAIIHIKRNCQTRMVQHVIHQKDNPNLRRCRVYRIELLESLKKTQLHVFLSQIAENATFLCLILTNRYSDAIAVHAMRRHLKRIIKDRIKLPSLNNAV